MKREALGRAEKWCLATTIVCAAPLIVAPIWWHRLNADVVVSIPSPKLPSPNAYDSYVAATQQLNSASKYWVHFATTPYQGNRAIPIMPALPVRPFLTNSGKNVGVLTQRTEFSMKEKLRMLKWNASALPILRKGFAFPYLQPPMRLDTYNKSPFGASPQTNGNVDYTAFIDLARVLVLQAQLQKARGDWNGALNTCLDGVRFGIDIPHGAPVQGAVIGQFIETLARAEVWPCVPHLSPAQARSAILRLQQLQKRRVPAVQTLQEEKWALQAALVLEFRDPNWRNTLFNNRDAGPPTDLGMRTSFISKQDIIDRIGHNLDAQIANARLPYTRQQKVFEKPDPLDEILGVTSFLLDSNRFFIRCQAQSALLMTALALQAYRAEHKSYPPTLSALVPRYLPAVPLDPFADHQPLHYKLRPLRYVSDIRHTLTGRMTRNRDYFRGAPSSISAKVPETKPHFEYSISPYTLYSIGANGKDDGGKPIENAAVTTSARDRYATDFNQSGDLVAGVNVQ